MTISSGDTREAILSVLSDVGTIIRDSRAGIENAKLKSDGSIVTEVDSQAQQIILGTLDELAIPATIIGEESPGLLSDAFIAQVSRSRYCWAVDPLDGTRNFAHGLPFIGISIGLLERTIDGLRPVLGAIHSTIQGMSIYFDSQGVVLSAIDGARKPLQIERLNQSGGDPLLLVGDGFLRGKIDFSTISDDFMPRAIGSTVLDFFSAATSPIGALITVSHIWDFVAGWGVLGALGYRSMRLSSSGFVPLSFVDVEDFYLTSQAPWLVRDILVFAHPNLELSRLECGLLSPSNRLFSAE